MPRLTPHQRNSRLGGLIAASRVDVKARAEKAQAGFLRRLETEVDPEGVLEPEERTRRAVALRRAWLIRIRGGQS
jgi:hypothetical protein